jgi:sulfur-oxidizing protein SoxX
MGSSSRKFVLVFSSLAFLAGSLALTPQISVADEAMASAGKKVAENRKKGNCFACHDYPGAVLPGNIGPKLVNMKQRYPDKKQLRDKIWDATTTSPNTIMPPFGRHHILSEQEIDNIVEFIYNL